MADARPGRSASSHVDARLNAQDQRLDRIEATLDRIEDSIKHSRQMNWAPVAILVSIGAFAVGLYVNSKDAHTRDVIAGGDRLLNTVASYTRERIMDLDNWRDDIRKWQDGVNHDLGSLKSRMTESERRYPMIESVDTRTRWMQGAYDTATQTLGERVTRLENTHDRSRQ